jgi:hypothetical protein
LTNQVKHRWITAPRAVIVPLEQVGKTQQGITPTRETERWNSEIHLARSNQLALATLTSNMPNTNVQTFGPPLLDSTVTT